VVALVALEVVLHLNIQLRQLLVAYIVTMSLSNLPQTPPKSLKGMGIFQFEEYATTTLWHVSSPINLAPATHPLPKFKYHLPMFSGINIVTMNEHLVAFSNACQNIGVVGPRPCFEDPWSCLTYFWDFDRLLKAERKTKWIL
jgi:hypothetical protein